MNLQNVVFAFLFVMLTSLVTVLSLKISKKEISKWTDQAIASKATLLDMKWFFPGLFFALFFSFFYSQIGNNLHLNDFNFLKEGLRIFLVCFWLGVLTALAQIDYKTRLLPDILTLPLALGGLFFLFLVNDPLISALYSALLTISLLIVVFFLFFFINSCFLLKNIV
tara:strand:+ start:232 stop:732 length:501 start_codon:yes stop_codon:yes gene_type:complete